MNTTSKTNSAGSRRRATPARRYRGKQPLKTRPYGSPGRLFSLLLLAVVLVSVIWNQKSLRGFINRPVTELVIINPVQRITPTELNNRVREHTNEGFFTLNLQAIKANIETHPWVHQASVKRVWPNAVAIEITEQVAIARWQDKQLMNPFGELFTPSAMDESVSLPLLNGPNDARFKVMEQYKLLSQMLFPAGLRLTGLSYSNRGSWQLVLNDGIQVTVGREDVLHRVQRFVNFYQNLPVNDAPLIAEADLRYANGIAIKTHQDQTMLAVGDR
ncbi:MAG: cell division protein FtsQ/DivIB [Pseudohongiellaceae bacterium]